MGSMFYGCSSLTELDVSGFETENVTDMYGMFSGCSSLTELDLSSFNTENVRTVSQMFYGCSNLAIIYKGDNWRIGLNTYIGGMFDGCLAQELTYKQT